MRGLRFINTAKGLLIFGCLVLTASLCAAQSVLQSGSWYKVGVEKHGVYKITYDDFRKMGFDPASTDPRKIKLYGNRGGMLPQANSIQRPDDLLENAIVVNGEADGKFDRDDFILFYGEGSYRADYDVKRKIFAYESNLYSARNFYFLTIGADNGKRIISKENISGDFPLVEEFEDYVYHEKDEYNDLQSGREWFGERFDAALRYNFPYELPGIVDGSIIKVVSDVMAQSFTAASFQLSFNGTAIADQKVTEIANSQYAVKGRHKRDTLTFAANTVSASSQTQQEITYQFTKAASGRSIGYLDFMLASFTRQLALYGDQTIFTSSKSLNQVITQYRVANISSNTLVWDITELNNIQQQQFIPEGGVLSFGATSDLLRKYIVFNDKTLAPELVGRVDNQNLHGLSNINLIIVTNPLFHSDAMRLASHRESHSGWSTAVVTPEQIYNEYSSGRQDVSAIRDFIRSMYVKNPGVLRSVLIMGKGSYDYKDRVSANTNFVPTYESRNSLSPLETYSSDDFFGFLEDSEGNWNELPAQLHTLDIGIGRLPVKTAKEAAAVVDKIIAYDSNKKNYGRWRKSIIFVADDGSISDGFSNVHQFQANSMADAIESGAARFDTRKIFLGTYSKTVRPNGEFIPEANKAIVDQFDQGALIINYTGHGSERLLADEKVFTTAEIDALKNRLLPFLVTATCEFGRQDDPAITSSAELTVIHPSGGCIGLVTTARPVNSPTNFILNQEFYAALLEKKNNRYQSMGDVFRQTKNNSISGVGNRNFSLLGDPSMTLALPLDSVVITSLKTSNDSDTLNALSTVTVHGEVRDENGARIESFNGVLESTLFDKVTQRVTIGQNNPAYTYTERVNALYRGKASVKNGEFEFQFVVPKNLAYQFGKGKLSLYASDRESGRDASGASNQFIIGGSETATPLDNTAPIISAFMGDTTFVNGGVITSNSTLVVKLFDASGINISNYGIGNTLTATLDDEQSFVLVDYFESATDDFAAGWIYYPISGLTPGKHSITVKAWDSHNNPAQATVDFMVTDGQALIIETLGNAPNPFENETKVYFTHNRSGDDLQAQLSVYSIAGETLKTYNFDLPASPYFVDLMEINGLIHFGKKLPPGVYLARLAVRSLTNGSKSERVAKLIVVN